MVVVLTGETAQNWGWGGKSTCKIVVCVPVLVSTVEVFLLVPLAQCCFQNLCSAARKACNWCSVILWNSPSRLGSSLHRETSASGAFLAALVMLTTMKWGGPHPLLGTQNLFLLGSFSQPSLHTQAGTGNLPSTANCGPLSNPSPTMHLPTLSALQTQTIFHRRCCHIPNQKISSGYSDR